jgi:hypothetical protein
MENRRKKSLHYQPLIFSGGEGGIATVVVEGEVRVGQRWYVSCFQRTVSIWRNRQYLCGF